MSGDLKRELRRRLGLAPSWLTRTELVAQLDASEWLVDNALADLVMAGAVLFNSRGQQYKLAGEPVAREALRELLARPDVDRFVVGRQSQRDPKLYRIGVAQRETARGPGLMYEVELPYPGAMGMLAVQQLMAKAMSQPTSPTAERAP